MSAQINRFVSFGIFAALAIIAFLIVEPFIAAIFTALLLSFMFRPLYLKINSKVKSPSAVALLVSLIVILLLVIFAIVTLQLTVKQVLDFYTYTQTSDVLAPIKALVAKFTNVDPAQFSFFFDTALQNMTSLVVNSINTIILDLPNILLQLVVTFFVMFYFIRDGDQILAYLKEVLPFTETTKNRLVQRFKDITYAVTYGSIVVGIIQGVSAGIGYYIFGVEGAFVLTMASILLSILPLGCWIIWLPASIGLYTSGNTGAGIGLFLYGLVVVSYIDNVIRAKFVSERTKLSPVTAVLGMLGGALLFGIIGIFIGPIILDYLLIFIEFYKKGQYESI